MKNSVHFEPNVPQEIVLKYADGRPTRAGFRVKFWLLDGRVMYVSSDLAKTFESMQIRATEAFWICKRWNGQRGRASKTNWDVWLAPETEKARAAEETAQVNSGAVPVETVREFKTAVLEMPIPDVSSPVERTGTGGAVVQPRKALERHTQGRIPFDVAFTEVVCFVRAGLEKSGEQWNDEARQAIVSTVLISAAKMGMLCLWER